MAPRVLHGGLRGDRRGDGRGRLPVLRRLPDDAVHRGARAHGQAAARGRRRRASTPRASSRPSAWRGARRRPAPGRATGSTGQGLSLMQESFSEIALAAAAARRSSTWPAARATTSRPPGAAGTATTATSCSRRWTSPRPSSSCSSRSTSPTSGATRCWSTATTSSRTPTQSVDVDADRLRPAAGEGLGASTARTGGTGDARLVSPLGVGKRRRRSGGYDRQHLRCVRDRKLDDDRGHRAARRDRLTRRRRDRGRRVRHARQVRALRRATSSRAEGAQVGYVRPITLWPFPYEAVAEPRPTGAAPSACYEINAGPDDRRRAPRRARARARCEFIGGLEPRRLRLRHRPADLDVERLRDRIRRAVRLAR